MRMRMRRTRTRTRRTIKMTKMKTNHLRKSTRRIPMMTNINNKSSNSYNNRYNNNKHMTLMMASM